MPVVGEIKEKTLSFMWQINNCFEIFNKNETVFSPYISDENHDWYLAFDPTSEKNAEFSELSVFLKYNDNLERNFVIKASILNSNKEIVHDCDEKDVSYFDNVQGEDEEFGWDKVPKSELTKTILNNFPNNVLLIHCVIKKKGVITEDNEDIEDYKYLYMEDFSNILVSESLADVQIRVKDTTFNAHKAILAARSSEFKKMFEKDSRLVEKKVINICDLEVNIMEDVLTYIYSGNSENMDLLSHELFAAAEKFKIIGLKKECENKMIEELCIDNVIDALLFAVSNNAETLEEKCLEFIANDVDKLMITESWLKLNISLVNSILRKVVRKNK